MAIGFKALNADGDILLSTEDDNQYFWIDDYTVSGVTYYGSSDGAGSAIALSSGQLDVSNINTDSAGTDLDFQKDLFFVHVPSNLIEDANITDYDDNGGFIGRSRFGDSRIVTQGIDDGNLPWVLPRTMNNFSGAETGYGINVYNSGGQEGGQSELKWSSNAQGHLDIVAVGLWQDAIDSATSQNATYPWFDITGLKISDGPYYVLLHDCVGPQYATWQVYRLPCYEFRYPATGENMDIRLHFSGIWGASNSNALYASPSNWVAGTGLPGHYMIVRKRP